MFRRFLHHFFWNFYDYLGSYLAQGALLVAALFVPLLGSGFLASMLPDGWMRAAALVMGALAFLVLLASGTAGTLSFAEVASRDAPARFPEFREGVRKRWKLCLRGLLVAGLAFAIAVANAGFYAHLARGSASPAGRTGLMIAAMVFLWIALGIAIFTLPFFAGLARFEGGVWDALRKSFVLFALAPMFWLLVFALVLSLAALCVISVAGIVFLVPVAASASTTALWLVAQHAGLLGQARQDLGEGNSIGAYRRRALELGWEWEHARPKRTLRELIKPWEM